MTHIPATASGVMVTPESAGWRFSGLRVVDLRPEQELRLQTGAEEMFVLPLSGSLTVQADESTFAVHGRTSVFTAATDFVYVGRDTHLTLRSASGAVVALPSARCDNRLPAAYGSAGDVPVEVRGAGPATRIVRNVATPQSWPHADRLMCCELITPGGNWSSYPPHKHDATGPSSTGTEEIYYYRIAGEDQVTPSRDGFGLHRTYTGAEHDQHDLARIDEFVEVRDGDVVLVPYGYHGPCVAAPGYPMYYLNVLAGEAGRSMAFCDDPVHTWVRDIWPSTAIDPRCTENEEPRWPTRSA